MPTPRCLRVLVATLTAALAMLAAASLARGEDSAPPSPCFDAQGRILHRGKPIFVRGWYSDGSIERLRRLAASPFNAVLDYGLTGRPVEETAAYLAEAERLGVAVILAVHDVYPSARYRERLGDWVGNDAILAGVVERFRASPALLAWYTNDEIPSELAPEILTFTRRLRGLDPHHPQLAVHFKEGGVRAFAATADVIGVDNYPVPRSPLLDVVTALERARAELTQPRPLWAVVQNFAWYQHRDPEAPLVPGDADTPRARLPAPREWRDGRAPTEDESRAMTYLSLVHGAQGLLYWSLYNLEYLPDREERWQAASRLAGEVRSLEPVLLEPGGEQLRAADDRVHALAKRHEGKLYVIAVNATSEPLRTEIALPAGAARGEVLFERRSINVAKGRLADFFAPYARHVYALPVP